MTDQPRSHPVRPESTASSEPEVAPEIAQGTAQSSPPAEPVRILLLEDSVLDAELALSRLRKAGLAAHVTVAQDRAGFEAALAAGPYSLVLSDYALPDFDGMAALSMSRERLPDVPFIFISGRVGEEVAIDTLQRGATDYVLKHRLERLVPAVQRALREARERSTRVQAERMFRESELRFRNVIDAVPQLIWVARPDGELIYSNQAWRSHAPQGVTHWHDPRLFHPDDHAHSLRAWKEAAHGWQPFSLDVRLQRHGEHAYRSHLLRMAPMQKNGNGHSEPPNWLGTATDLEDRKLNEEALRAAEKLSVIGRMAAAIAHEINNPLESLTNLLFLIRLESENQPRTLEYLNLAETELERAGAITKQTLQFYRDPAVPVTIDVHQILDEVLRLFKAKLLTKSIATTLKVDAGLCLNAIQGELRQVLINLVGNAIDAVSNLGQIDLEGSPCDLAGEPAVCLRVYDNGSGITAEQAERLFTPFFSTKGAQGTGLGLWVSKGIVEKHGGTLTLASSPVQLAFSPRQYDSSSDQPASSPGQRDLSRGPSTTRTLATVLLPSKASPQITTPPPDGAGSGADKNPSATSH